MKLCVPVQIAIDQTRLGPPEPPSAPNVGCPLGQLKHPPAAHNHPANHIHQPHDQAEETRPALRHNQQDGFDVVFEEHPRNGVAGDFARLRGRGVLVGEDRLGV